MGMAVVSFVHSASGRVRAKSRRRADEGTPELSDRRNGIRQCVRSSIEAGAQISHFNQRGQRGLGQCQHTCL